MLSKHKHGILLTVFGCSSCSQTFHWLTIWCCYRTVTCKNIVDDFGYDSIINAYRYGLALRATRCEKAFNIKQVSDGLKRRPYWISNDETNYGERAGKHSWIFNFALEIWKRLFSQVIRTRIPHSRTHPCVSLHFNFIQSAPYLTWFFLFHYTRLHVYKRKSKGKN
jgi:hypothetical protein